VITGLWPAARRRWSERCRCASASGPASRGGASGHLQVDAQESLLAARAIAYTDPASGGTAGVYLAKLFEKMGIADQLRPKTVLVKGGLAGEKIVSGEADIAMQPASEILAVPGVELVGPIPLEVQTYIIYAGAVSARRAPRPLRMRCLALHGPDTAALSKRKGMELP
jgi:molybdate transport system substrate-binding protein